MSKNKKKEEKRAVHFPAKLIQPIGFFLRSQLKKLERNKKKIETEDPFKDVSRVIDNAAPDADAEEQFGHARTLAIKEQLERKIIQTKKALTRIKIGKYGICERCSQMIDTERLMIYPEATVCVKCEDKKSRNKNPV